jgi:hypothetical protein
MSDFTGPHLDNNLFASGEAEPQPTTSQATPPASESTIPKIERGNAGADFGRVVLGPYLTGDSSNTLSTVEQTIQDLLNRGVQDPYGTIEDE